MRGGAHGGGGDAAGRGVRDCDDDVWGKPTLHRQLERWGIAGLANFIVGSRLGLPAGGFWLLCIWDTLGQQPLALAVAALLRAGRALPR